MRVSALLYLTFSLSLTAAAEHGAASAEALFDKAFAALVAHDQQALASCYPAEDWLAGVGADLTAEAAITNQRLITTLKQAGERYGADAIAKAVSNYQITHLLALSKIDLSGPKPPIDIIAEGRAVLKWPYRQGDRKRQYSYRAFARDGVWYLYDNSMDNLSRPNQKQTQLLMFQIMLTGVKAALSAADATGFAKNMAQPLEELRKRIQATFQPEKSFLIFARASHQADRYKMDYAVLYGSVPGAVTVRLKRSLVAADGSEIEINTEDIPYKENKSTIGGGNFPKDKYPDATTSTAKLVITWLDANGGEIKSESLTAAFDLASLKPREPIFKL